ncbi:DNA helicase [Rhodococcus hoagii]|nr:DNA helicase [Prescottella equi]NKS56598.1 DNA helicase [Prescottella equi]
MTSIDDLAAIEPADEIQPDDLADDPREDIEALCLCALLWAPADAAARIAAVLEPSDFYRPIYAELYTVIADLVRTGVPHGTAMVAAKLEQDGRLGGHTGQRLAKALTDVTLAGADGIAAGHYAHAVIRRAYRRGFHDAAQSLAQAAATLPEDQLFEHMVTLGTERRAATRRLAAIQQNPL